MEIQLNSNGLLDQHSNITQAMINIFMIKITFPSVKVDDISYRHLLFVICWVFSKF